MLKKILSCLREYKLPTFLTLFFILAEAGIEALLPFIMTRLVTDVQNAAPMNDVLRVGIILMILAIVSMMCGGSAGFTASKAATGLSKNLRHDMFERVQTYSFENIDKFSSSSLVTRMTTDITNVQMAFMMIIRMGLRSPLMFIFSVFMAFI
ncbi:MAG: ABC transporter ATP-binding protein, partial [Oscillospiraceae bacterium]|nr:ABC transporter ATP-binding protein [Oscillospiraceae bacterium]